MTSVHIDVTMAFVSTNPIFVTEELIVPMIIQMSETVRLTDLFQNLRLNRLDVELILKLCVQIKVNNFSIIFLLNLFVYIWQKLVSRLFTFQVTRICEEDRCDGVDDCPRESGDTKSFDEQDCPTYPDVTFAPPTSSKYSHSVKKLSIPKLFPKLGKESVNFTII